VIAHRADKLHGILNGVDYEIWNPATDRLLDVRFDHKRIALKAAAKAALQKQLGLAVDPAAC
jgi:starch synthase